MNYKLLAFKKQAKWGHTSMELIYFDHKGFINV